ncbi:hypothetical protein NQ318_012785, partial [Aromia moschata]
AEQLSQGILALNHEQKTLCSEAARSTLSSTRLCQRLFIFKRYFIALSRVPHSVGFDHYVARKSSSKPASLDPATGLARVGSRAALNFSFAFLRRAWRLGEDMDLCSELLNESLEALRMLPVATLFEQNKVSPVWL